MSQTNINYRGKGAKMQAVSSIVTNNVITLNKTKLNNVNNVSESVPNKHKVNGNDVHRIASYLSNKLNDHGSFEFFCKVAWQLPEVQIMNNLEDAMKGRSPQRLFTWLCNRELSKR